MKNRYNIFILAIAVFILLQSHCTGVSPAQMYPYTSTTNTNPAQEYSTIKALTKGGFFYHKAYVGGATGNARVEKIGRACNYSFLWLIGFGNSGINAARKQGGIQKIALVEYEILGIGAFVYHRFCTIVHGE